MSRLSFYFRTLLPVLLKPCSISPLLNLGLNTKRRPLRNRTFHQYLLSLFLILSVVAPPVLAESWVYTVRPGDTLWDLCKKYTNYPLCWRDLAKTNNVTNPKVLPPGSKLKLPIAWLKVKPVTAHVESVEGEVRWLSMAAEEGKWSALSAGDELQIGDEVESLKGSATIRFADDSRLYLLPNTKIQMDQLSGYKDTGMVDTKVRLEKGRVRSRVKALRTEDSNYEINTPSAVAAVRGTVFRVGYLLPKNESDKPYMLNEVLEGKVAVSAQGKTELVTEGFSSVTVDGEAPEAPESLLAAPEILSQPAIVNNALRVDWKPVADAEAYFVKLMGIKPEISLQSPNTVATEAAVLLATQRVSATTYQVNNLAVGDYQIIVNGISKRESFGQESKVAVRIDPIPELTKLKIPRVIAQNKTLSIEDPVESNDSLTGSQQEDLEVRIEISKGKEFSNLIHQAQHASGQIEIPALEAGEYFLRAAWVNDAQLGPYSEAQAFTIEKQKNYCAQYRICWGILSGIVFLAIAI